MDKYSTIISNGLSSKSREIVYRIRRTKFNAITVTTDAATSLKDLYNTVAIQYASKWEQLGLQLGLEHYHIANITKDNAHNPDQSVTCCRNVLEKWLQTDPSPTWGKLNDVIKSLTTAPAILSSTDHKGKSILLLLIYYTMRSLPL